MRQSWFDNLPIPKILLPLDMYRALARNEKNYAFCMNWEIKLKWGSEEHCEPIRGRALGKFTIFS